MSDLLVEARGLTKRFGEFTAVDAVDFHIEKGEAFEFKEMYPKFLADAEEEGEKEGHVIARCHWPGSLDRADISEGC